MTYSDSNRLDRLERIVEINTQQLGQFIQTTQFLTSAQLELARSVDVVTRRMDTLTERVDRVEQHVSQLVDSQQNAIDSQRFMLQSLERLASVQEQLAEQQVSTNAAVERLDRILDYLIRRDGER